MLVPVEFTTSRNRDEPEGNFAGSSPYRFAMKGALEQTQLDSGPRFNDNRLALSTQNSQVVNVAAGLKEIRAGCVCSGKLSILPRLPVEFRGA